MENQYIFQKQKDLPVRFLNATFGKLLEFTKLTEDRAVQMHTLYSLRNIYPTQALLGGTGIHTLAKQMGNSFTNVGTALQQTSRQYGSRKIGLKVINKFKLITATAVLSFLSACGGGGGQATSGTAEGIWVGSSSTGYRVALAVLENAETWGVYYTRNNGYIVIYGALYGTSNGTGSTFSSTGSDFNLLKWSVVNGSVTGTVVPKSTINAVATSGATVSLTYSTTYDSPALLSTIAGSYIMNGVSASGTSSNAPMTIDANGAVRVVGNGCSAAGTVLPRSSGKNIYNINVTFTGTNCALGNGGTASGIFTLDRTVTPNIALTLALTPSKQDGFIGIGTKQ